MGGRNMTADGLAAAVRALTADGAALSGDSGLRHAALLYDSTDFGPLAAIAKHAAHEGSPLHVVVPAATLRLVSAALPPPPRRMIFADMADLGRNPARLIAAGHSFADKHLRDRVCCLWEPAWPGRSAPELLEVARHEALCNIAFRGREMTIMCLYDTALLPAAVINDAARTHPVVITSRAQQLSPAYLGAGQLPPGCDGPLPAPPADAISIDFEGRLGPVREFSAAQARAAGLESTRVSDLVLAVSEIAANALSHAAGGGVVRSWCTSDELLCDIEDEGHIADPLAGRRRLPADARGGHGLWLVNMVCDLVERRTSAAGTVTRLHMRRESSRSGR
jgi:anti-sigma regulatory factor (Ser/Thr protein kinase)